MSKPMNDSPWDEAQQQNAIAWNYHGQQAMSQEEMWQQLRRALASQANLLQPLPESIPLDAPKWMLDIWGTV